MFATSTLLAIGIGLSAVGMATQAYSGMQQAEGQKKSIEAQQKSEALRYQSMELDSARRKREMIRKAQLQSAQGESIATNQGAGQSSGIEGVLGGISGQSGTALQGIEQNRQIGAGLFQANQEKLQAGYTSANASTIGSIGQGIDKIGGMVMSNASNINKLGTYYGNRYTREQDTNFGGVY